MDEKNKVKLRICGSDFIVVADENKDYIRKTAKRVDTKVNETIKENEKLSIGMATIVVALNYLDELQKEKEASAILSSTAEKNQSIADIAIAENKRLKEENEKLLEEKLGLHSRIEELKKNFGVTHDSVSSANILHNTNPTTQGSSEINSTSTPPVQKNQQVNNPPINSWVQPKQNSHQIPPQKPVISRMQKPNVQPVSGTKPALNNVSLPLQKGSATSNQPSKPLVKPSSSKIDYQANDQINDSYRRDDFADDVSDDEIISFFDNRT